LNEDLELSSISMTSLSFSLIKPWSKYNMSPIIALSSELFPEPTSPITQTNSPCLMFKLTFLSAIIESKVIFYVSLASFLSIIDSSRFSSSIISVLSSFLGIILVISFEIPQWKLPSLMTIAFSLPSSGYKMIKWW